MTLASTPTLFRAKPDTPSLMTRYRDTIASQAVRYNLPGELVAAVMVDHQAQQSTFRDVTELNISYEARELGALRDRSIRFAGMSAETLIHQWQRSQSVASPSHGVSLPSLRVGSSC